eukprot:9956177-Alexandrium_andersonii.AAC.1
MASEPASSSTCSSARWPFSCWSELSHWASEWPSAGAACSLWATARWTWSVPCAEPESCVRRA